MKSQKLVIRMMELDQCIIDAAMGNKEALQELYNNYSSIMFKFALSIVKRYDLAEDVIQDVFVNLMQYGQNSKIKHPKSWLFTIVHNQSLKVLKDQKVDKLVSLEDYPIVSEEKDSVKDYIDNALENIEALKCLNDIELQIITLCIYGEFTQLQVSKILGLSYIKVRSKYNYAVKKLRKFYIDRSDSYD